MCKTYYKYTGCFILIAPGKYLEKYGNYEKMFRTKVVWFLEGHKIVTHWFDLEQSFEGHVRVTSIFLNGTPYIF